MQNTKNLHFYIILFKFMLSCTFVAKEYERKFIMKVLVTGGAGFIGSHTVVELLNDGSEVIIVDNYVNSNPEVLNRIRAITGKDFLFYEADLLDRPALEKIFAENEGIDAVIHFAGL